MPAAAASSPTRWPVALGSMRNLADAIVRLLERAVATRLDQRNRRMQLVFVGPPREALVEAFSLMTADGTADWSLPGTDDPVVVLLVDTEGHLAPPSGISSARCTWDYALSMRVNAGTSVILATRDSWDDLPESIENTSEIIGRPRAASRRPFLALPPWPNVLDELVESSGFGRTALRKVFGDLFDDGRQLDPSAGESLPWKAIDEVLGGKDIVLAAGLPAPADGRATDEDLRLGRQVLKHLADLCGRQGLSSVEGELSEARLEYRQTQEQVTAGTQFLEDETALHELFDHLRVTAGSGGDFQRAPSAYFRPDTATEWWSALNVNVLKVLLDLVDGSRPRGRLRLSLFPALESTPLPGEPALVQSEVSLQVFETVSGEEAAVPAASFGRRYPGHNEAWSDVEGGTFVDSDVPEHDHPLAYQASFGQYPQARIKVLSLDQFECRGHARIAEATQNPPPARAGRRRGPFEQEITVARAGQHELTVFAASDVAQVQLVSDGVSLDAKPGNAVSFVPYLEDGDSMDVVLLSKDDGEIGRWTLAIHVEEPDDGLARSRFEDLVESHREGKARRRAIRARVSQLRDLEQQYMSEPRSWLGLVACWSSEGAALGRVDWDTGVAGDVEIRQEFIERPLSAISPPPQAYVEKRTAVVAEISRFQRPISECDLGGDELARLTAGYLSEYLAWLKQDAKAALWTDCIALYVRTTTGQARGLPGSEPAAVLVSPLHPLRLSWHVLAQSVLLNAQREQPWCPLVGLLNPHLSPSLIALPLQRGETTDWRPFLAVGSDEPHWSTLLNARDLGNPDARQELLAVLKRLGFTPEGPTGGVTKAQAKRAIGDVVKILPTRSTLRLGLVGGTLEAAGAVAGVTGWIREAFAERPVEDDAADAQEVLATRARGPDKIEVFDFRGEGSYPTEANLALLTEEVGDRVRWFGRPAQPPDDLPRLDLVVFDQIETTNLEVTKPRGEWISRSVLGSAALYRLNIREDPGAAQWIRQARVAGPTPPRDGHAGLLEQAIVAVEEICLVEAGASHLRFEPNQQAIADWVAKARFVTATSSQVDPACFIRGSGPATGYLWDYELPGVLESEDRAGYYLIASAAAAMKESIRANLATVLTDPPAVDPILSEISRRGIPVLKRLASEGSHSRGEIGVLLAVRLLQDAFREPHSGVRLAVAEGSCVHMILAVDSYREPLDQVRKALRMEGTAERGDLLVFAINQDDGRAVIDLTPVEVKYVATQNELMLPDALNQANNLGELLRRLFVEQPASELWSLCGRAFLAEALDQCFRVYADRRLHGLTEQEWAQLHVETLQAVLSHDDLEALVTVNPGKVLAFGGWNESRTLDMDGDGVSDTAVFTLEDAAYLLNDVGALSEEARDAVGRLGFSVPGCDGTASSPTDHGRPAVAPVAPRIDDEDEESDIAIETPVDDISPAAGPGALQASTSGRVREAFEGFIGNENAVQQLTRDLVVALMREPPHLSKNILLQGLPSVGKTELARRVSRALDLPFVHLDGPSLTSRERLFQLIDGQLAAHGARPADVGRDGGAKLLEYPPFVVFVDEVHLVARSVQESLLTMLEPTDRRARLTDRIVLVRQATFIFATTRASKLDPALRSRCNRIDLRPYDVGQVAEMVKRRAQSDYGVLWEDEVYLRIAQLSRLVPRLAFGLAEDVTNEMIANPTPKPVLEHLEAVRISREIDENGLRLLDLDYLEALERADRPLGEDSIANQLGTVDRDEVVNEIEPALLRMRLIERTQGGRVITPGGREYLARRRFNTPS
jgi:DNA phosphorothioation-dependent restriction protein DptH